MAFEKELPQWKEKGVKPPQSKLDEGWKVQDKPPAAWLNWQMNKTYEALKEVQEKAAEKTEVASAIEDTKKYTDQKVGELGTHAGDATKHITAAERNAWNAKETPEGAQAKANQAESNAKVYTDSKPWQKHQVTEGVNAKVVADLNTDLLTGWYMGADMVGAPTNEWHYVEHIRHNELWCVQNAYCFNRNSYYTRAKRNGSWGAWSQDLFQSGVDAKNRIAGAINAKGVPASASDDFATLAAKIGHIKTELKHEGRNSETWDKIDVENLAFEPSIVIAKATFYLRDPGFWIKSYVELVFIKGQNNSAGTTTDCYVNSEKYANFSADIEWAPNGFMITGRRGYGHFDQQVLNFQSWEAFGY
ncbi:pyocin knob domain-containing protein [Paenibacillus alvei]|uniref:Pyocin knob domain-containing protein n=1 Tax=Paenibacillus alvei TaxID=44250 RepID=A0ABT4GW55_PAEAL|nr:pyocin knob domain-containing protein [Paenibacillus alvei]EJW19115.1 hypothetical protein PAV_1c00860 [Paenibacillus alvei DSM 29]MCY7487838.1 pyocin knob domain-containing protein [Paenibacillus alvei]MCY9542283.1 pyocin knob domain-containing protein [Paenibacillus alvei]MCY9707280.1 pyocin knob domain-containing protein [Paenibacillus alvei]MCY9736193.1 pyocin knob domain-containing protein [Paenibacillus alvei]